MQKRKRSTENRKEKGRRRESKANERKRKKTRRRKFFFFSYFVNFYFLPFFSFHLFFSSLLLFFIPFLDFPFLENFSLYRSSLQTSPPRVLSTYSKSRNFQKKGLIIQKLIKFLNLGKYHNFLFGQFFWIFWIFLLFRPSMETLLMCDTRKYVWSAFTQKHQIRKKKFKKWNFS